MDSEARQGTFAQGQAEEQAARQRAWRKRVGRVGVWLSSLVDESSTAAETATVVEDLGFGALWIGGGAVAEDAFDRMCQAAEATSSLVLATGIANVWARPAPEMVAAAAVVDRARSGSFLLGLGISHQPLVERLGHAYERPYAHMVRYLDEMDLAPPAGAAAPARVLAALGPKMLRLARDRSVGAHPYFVPVAHTARARAELGEAPLLAPEVAVVLETDSTSARSAARNYAQRYLQMPNYVENLRRLGYGEDDFADGGSDRLIDAVIPWGDEAAIVAHVQAHLDAGADHVSVQPITGGGLGLDAVRRLAPALVAL